VLEKYVGVYFFIPLFGRCFGFLTIFRNMNVCPIVGLWHECFACSFVIVFIVVGIVVA
jgi:hypothetical protein